MNKPEFKPGDKVTFNPYGDAIPAKVVEVSRSPLFEPDDRVFYRLTGTNPKKPLVSITTGKSIMESALYSTDGNELCD